jgi:hypothetical protein
MKRFLSVSLGIAQTAVTIALVCIAIVFFTYFGLEMAANWDGPDPGYHLSQTFKETIRSSRFFLEGLIQGDLGQARMVSGDREVSVILWESYKINLRNKLLD